MAAQRIGSYVEIAPGVDIYYEDEGEGEGPPLVLIPGWTFTTRVVVHQFACSCEGHVSRASRSPQWDVPYS